MSATLLRENANIAARGIHDRFDLAIGLEATTVNQNMTFSRSADGNSLTVISQFGSSSPNTAPSLLLHGVANALGIPDSPLTRLVLPNGSQMVNLLTRNVVANPRFVLNPAAPTINVAQGVLPGAAWNDIATELRRLQRDRSARRSVTRSVSAASVTNGLFHFGAIIALDGSVTNVFSQRLNGPVELLTEPVVQSNWRMVFLDSNKQELGALPFTPEFDDSGSASVLLTVLLPADCSAVRLANETTTLWQKEFSKNPPTMGLVAASALAEHQQKVEWSAQDTDGENLTFTVLIRGKGDAADRVVATGVTGNELVFDGSLLPAGAAVVTIEASDGYNTASAASAPFLIQPAPLLLAITGFDTNGLRLSSQSVVLEGAA